MEHDARVWIAALRTGHDRLAAFVEGASGDDLVGPSMCSDWNVAQVLSHLGSGAEIGLATASASPVDNNEVWDRWNAKSPQDMADSFVAADERLVSWWESQSDADLAALRVNFGFLPEPADAVMAAGLRLNELALHRWDVLAAVGAEARLAPEATDLLLDRLPMLVGMLGRFLPRETRPANDTAVSVTTSSPDRQLRLVLGEGADLGAASGEPSDADATMPAEALVRLVAGRLGEGHDDGVTVTGALTLDDLRRAFPGF